MKLTLRTAAVVVAASLALPLSGCIGGAATPETTGSAAADLKPSGDIEVVSFYPQGSADHDRLSARAKEFEAKYPGTGVKLVFGGGQDTPKIQARWRAGNPPEVNYGFFDGTTADGRKYAEAGQVLALDTWLDQPLDGFEGTWREAMLPSVKPFMTLTDDGKAYAVPESVSTIQLFYNKKIFEEQGITPPTTVEELLAAAAKLKGAGVTPFSVTGTFDGYMQLWFDYLALRYVGAQNMQAAIAGTKDLSALPGIDKASAALETMVSSGYFPEGFKSTDFTAAQLNFFQGKSAMLLMGSWLQGEMKDSIPSDFQLGSFPFPKATDGEGDQDAVFGSSNLMVVAAASKNPTTAVAWLRFNAGKANQDTFVKDTNQISAYRGVAAPAGFESVVKGLDAPNAFVPSYFGVFGAGSDVAAAYQKPISKVFFGQSTATQMVDEMTKSLLAANGG